MEIPNELVYGLVVAVLGGGGGAAAFLRRNGSPLSRRQEPRQGAGEEATAPAQCSDAVEQQVREVHEIVARRDDFGGSLLLRSLDETAKNTAAMREALDEIRRSLAPRPPMGSQPGAAE